MGGGSRAGPTTAFGPDPTKRGGRARPTRGEGGGNKMANVTGKPVSRADK